MRLAVISDIHANLPALEAVLADIDRQAVDDLLCLGDLVGYAPWPNEVIDMVRSRTVPTIMGNYDDGTGFDRDDCGCQYKDPRLEALGDRSLEWTKAHTTANNKAYLRELLPHIRRTIEGHAFLFVHGSPRKLNEYVYEDRPRETLERIAASAHADILLFGHTHLPYKKQVGSVQFINTGTVGKPKDGDPRAGYVILEITPEAVTPQFIRVPYDVEKAAQAIEASGLPVEFAWQLRAARGDLPTVVQPHGKATMEPHNRQRYLAEFIGTFGLVFAGCGAIVVDTISNGAVTHLGIALTFGLVVMAMIYATGHISGAHLNPAVTLGFLLTRHLPLSRAVGYWLAQLGGALLAALSLRLLFGSVALLGATQPRGSDLQAFGLEVVLTFFLMFVIMAVATDTRAQGGAAAIAIGGTVALEALFGGPISGASMNPARSLAPAIISGTVAHLWVYVVAPLIGAALGAMTYTVLKPPQSLPSQTSYPVSD